MEGERFMSASELADLVRKAQAGDAAALNDLLCQLQNLIYYTALKLLGDVQDAEDASQEVCVKILEALPLLRDPMTVLSWTGTITRNTCKNILKRRNAPLFLENGEELLDVLPEEADDVVPDRYMDMAAKREIILGMIDSLPEKQRVTVYLYYYSGCSVEEIAQFMEVSEGTVKSRLAAARASLKAQVEDEERKGNKLYIILPFLGRLLREDAEETRTPPLPVTQDQLAAAAAGYAAAAVAGTAAGKAAAETAGAEGQAAKAAQAAEQSAKTAEKAAGAAEKSAGALGRTAAAAGGRTAGLSLGAKVAIGVIAAAVLAGGVALFSGAFQGDETQPPEVTASAAVRPAAEPTPESSAEPTPTPELTPEATADPTAFDPEAMLGQPLSAMTDLFGQPTETPAETYCRWYAEDGSYDFSAGLFSDGETIREIVVTNGPAILGIHAGDSAQAAQDALAALGGAGGVKSVDAGGGQTTYSGTTADNGRIYQFGCIGGMVINAAVDLNQAP